MSNFHFDSASGNFFPLTPSCWGFKKHSTGRDEDPPQMGRNGGLSAQSFSFLRKRRLDSRIVGMITPSLGANSHWFPIVGRTTVLLARCSAAGDGSRTRPAPTKVGDQDDDEVVSSRPAYSPSRIHFGIYDQRPVINRKTSDFFLVLSFVEVGRLPEARESPDFAGISAALTLRRPVCKLVFEVS